MDNIPSQSRGTRSTIQALIIAGSCFVLVGVIAFLRTTQARATSADLALAVAQYPNMSGSRLDTCSFCHTSAPNLNPFGQAYLANGRNAAALKAIEGMDSDGDGFTNIQEIMALTFPGNPSDFPAQPTATRTPTQRPTATRTPTSQPTATNTGVPQPSSTPTATIVPPSSSETPTATETPTEIATEPGTATETPTAIPAPSETPTVAPTETQCKSDDGEDSSQYNGEDDGDGENECDSDHNGDQNGNHDGDHGGSDGDHGGGGDGEHGGD